MKAFILAAGLGTRLGHFTQSTPKPLVLFKNKPLISYTLDNLLKAGIKHIGFNYHYLGDQLFAYVKSWAKQYPDVVLTPSDERQLLLDTGGALVKAVTLLENPPFFLTLNSDTFWVDEEKNTLIVKLINAFDVEKMDALLGLVLPSSIEGHKGSGDFSFQKPQSIGPLMYGQTHMYVGLQIISSRLLMLYGKNEPFSLRSLWDQAIEQRRLYGLELAAPFFHVGDAAWLLQNGVTIIGNS